MPSRGRWRRTTSSGLLQSGVVEADRLDMRLEFHQLERRLEHLRVHRPEAQRKLLASLAVNGEQMPIVVVAAGPPPRNPAAQNPAPPRPSNRDPAPAFHSEYHWT